MTARYLNRTLGVICLWHVLFSCGYGQCPIEFTIPTDITICAAEDVDLDGLITSPNFLSAEWQA